MYILIKFHLRIMSSHNFQAFWEKEIWDIIFFPLCEFQSSIKWWLMRFLINFYEHFKVYESLWIIAAKKLGITFGILWEIIELYHWFIILWDIWVPTWNLEVKVFEEFEVEFWVELWDMWGYSPGLYIWINIAKKSERFLIIFYLIVFGLR